MHSLYSQILRRLVQSIRSILSLGVLRRSTRQLLVLFSEFRRHLKERGFLSRPGVEKIAASSTPAICCNLEPPAPALVRDSQTSGYELQVVVPPLLQYAPLLPETSIPVFTPVAEDSGLNHEVPAPCAAPGLRSVFPDLHPITIPEFQRYERNVTM